MNNDIRPSIFYLMTIIILCLMQTQCATISANKPFRAPITRPEWIEKEFTNTLTWADKSEQNNGFKRITLELRDASEQVLTDSDNEMNNPIILDYYRCSSLKPQPALLISPILGGKNWVASHFARYFSKHGYHCIVVHRPKDITKNTTTLEQLQKKLHDAVIRDRVALDWLCEQPGINRHAIGSFGVSYGGIKNAILAGVDNRLKANIFALAGADMTSLISNSNHKKLRNIKKIIKNISTPNTTESRIDHLKSAETDKIQVEPIQFAPYIDPSKTLLILARFDHTVPRANGEILRQALGFPRTVYIPSGHYSAALFTGMFGLPYLESKTREFFDKHLKTTSG